MARAAKGEQRIARLPAEHSAIAATVRQRVADAHADIAAGDAMTRPDVQSTIDRYIEDIAGSFHPGVHRAVVAILRPLLGVAIAPLGVPFTASSPGLPSFDARVKVSGPLDRLRDLADRDTLVLAPTHSSNGSGHPSGHPCRAGHH